MKSPKLFIIIFGLIIILASAFISIYFIKLPDVDITTRVILFTLFTINILALFTLIFFVGKNLFYIYIESKKKILGYKFKVKLMTFFVILTLIPSAFLFIAASGLATRYINQLLSPQMKEPFKMSIGLARAFYDNERERALKIAKDISKGKGYPIFDNILVNRYSAIPENPTDTIKEAFLGKEGTEIISNEKGDIIRAAVPEKRGKTNSIITVEIMISEEISKKSARLKEIYEDYLKIEEFKMPLRINFVFILGFLTLMMVFTSIWISIKIARDITIPIQNLAFATEKAASGDLNVHVDINSKDEIGLLIHSFNQMIKQLRENKESLQNAYMESDRRRLYLENILENINSGVIFLDNSGKIVTVNRAVCSILHLKQTDIIGKTYSELVNMFKSDDLADLVRKIEGKEVRQIKKDVKINIKGENVILRIYIFGIREEHSSKALGMLVVFDNITDIVNAQKLITWQEMARRLAHEIKNPLTPIKLSTERLIKKWHQKDADFETVFEKSTKTIISEVESLKRLVDVFSLYGKMPDIHKSPFNIIELIDDITNLYRGYKDLEIKVSIEDNISTVNLDKEQFKRALINIIDNAIKAMDEKGLIHITLKIEEEQLILEIADTGKGIPDIEKEKLFLPYFSTREDGTGLGLAIANKIIGDHGGTIKVRDNYPKGAIFSIYVPINA